MPGYPADEVRNGIDQEGPAEEVGDVVGPAHREHLLSYVVIPSLSPIDED
jgi:hypothetical protein